VFTYIHTIILVSTYSINQRTLHSHFVIVVWTSVLSVSSSAVRHQRGIRVDLQSAVVGPRDVSLEGTALANCSRLSQIQGRHAGLPLSTRHCSAISVDVTTSRCGRRLQSTPVPRRRLRSSPDTDVLLIPRSRLVFGDRLFPVPGPRTLNNLPETVRSASSLPWFKLQLKNSIFSRRYILDTDIPSPSNWILQFSQM